MSTTSGFPGPPRSAASSAGVAHIFSDASISKLRSVIESGAFLSHRDSMELCAHLKDLFPKNRNAGFEPLSTVPISMFDYNLSAIRKAQNVQNSNLLRTYTDSGLFSKLIAMSVAATVLNAKYSEEVLSKPLKNKQQLKFQQFVDEMGVALSSIVSSEKVDQMNYIILWRLNMIFNRGLDQQPQLTPPESSNGKTSLKDTLKNSPYNSNFDGTQRPASRGSRPSSAQSAVSLDEEVLRKIEPLNSQLAKAVRSPIGRFLVVYARYVDTGYVKKVPRLAQNQLNPFIVRYMYKVANIDQPKPLKRNKNSARPQVSSAKPLPTSETTAGDPADFSLPEEPSKKPVKEENNNDQTAPQSPPKSRKKPLPKQLADFSEKDIAKMATSTEQGFIAQQQSCETASTPTEKPSRRQNTVFHIEKKICVDGCKYEIIRKVATRLGFEIVGTHDSWNIIWSDAPMSLERALEMRRFQVAYAAYLGCPTALQKANHFPGMNEICRKDKLARNLNRLRSLFPQEYDFFPRTWSLPADMAGLANFARNRKDLTMICKPDSGCQGKGIYLIQQWKRLNPFSRQICQVYIPKPLLINGYKFDFRIYVLITSCDPLRIFVYNEGIARFATIEYEEPSEDNLHLTYMHLTNYSLNKFSRSYDDDGSKRTMTSVMAELARRGVDVDKLRASIDAVIVKTMIAGHPTLKHYYRASFPKQDYGSSCFEILGFDVLIDQKLKPWLIEVNHSPSFQIDLPVDTQVKRNLIKDTFNIIYMGGYDSEASEPERQKQPKLTSGVKRILKAMRNQIEHELANKGNYRLIYPSEECDMYNMFFDQSACPHLMNEGKLRTAV